MPSFMTNPRTDSQTANREGFAQLIKFAKPLLTEVLKPLGDRWAKQMGGHNLFVQRNRDYFDSTGLITPASVVISVGNIFNPGPTDVYFHRWTKNVDVYWSSDLNGGEGSADDTVHGMFYNYTQDDIATFSGTKKRSDIGERLVLNNPAVQHDQGYLYMSFLSFDGLKVSDTQYLSITATIGGEPG